MIEMLDVLDWKTGEKTGGIVARTEAHQKGVPHKAMHLWVYSHFQGQLVLLLQQRSFEKPNFPGQFGPTVGGHVICGEGLSALVREADEEIGLCVTEDQLERLGYNPYHFSLPGGYEDYEWIEDWRTFSEQSFEHYQFNDGEVIGMMAIRLPDLVALQQGPQKAWFFGGKEQGELQLTASQMVDGLFESPLFGALVNPQGLKMKDFS